MEQESASLQVKLEAANKRHKREIEESISRAQESAQAESQERFSVLEKQIRDAERGERDAVRKYLESDAICNDLKTEIKALSENMDQTNETLRHLESELAKSKNRYSFLTCNYRLNLRAGVIVNLVPGIYS